MLWVTFLLQKIYVYIQPLLHNASQKATEFDKITQNKDHYAIQDPEVLNTSHWLYDITTDVECDVG